MNRIKVWLSAILLCVTTSCASVPQVDSQSITSSYIQVDNENWADVTVYLVDGGLKQRLGTVTSLSKQRFGILKSMVDRRVHFQLHLLAGTRDYVLDDFQIFLPTSVELTIGEPVNYSHFEVYRQ